MATRHTAHPLRTAWHALMDIIKAVVIVYFAGFGSALLLVAYLHVS